MRVILVAFCLGLGFASSVIAHLSGRDPNRGSHLDLNARREAFLVIGGLAVNLAANAKLAAASPTRPEAYARSDLWVQDRWLAGTYAPVYATASDWLVIPVTGALPLLDMGFALTGRAGWRPVAEDMLVLSQALAWSSALNLLVRSAAVHPRPLVFNPSAPREERTAPEARGSFYSGHANAAFAGIAVAATLLPARYPELHPVYVWVVGGALASGVAGLRVAAGKHYLSDVVVGAAAGTAFGWAFAKWHLPATSRGAGSSGSISLQPDPRGGALAVYRF